MHARDVASCDIFTLSIADSQTVRRRDRKGNPAERGRQTISDLVVNRVVWGDFVPCDVSLIGKCLSDCDGSVFGLSGEWRGL